MIDLSVYANTTFYAGRPDRASADELLWDGVDYAMAVRREGDMLFAVMTSGECEWRTPIDPTNLQAATDAALQDACQLGHAANWSNDE